MMDLPARHPRAFLGVNLDMTERKKGPPMIERVARAIADEMSKDHSNLHPTTWPLARAAIAALREPNSAMYKAGTNVSYSNSLTSIWQAMIDAALNDQ